MNLSTNAELPVHGIPACSPTKQAPSRSACVITGESPSPATIAHNAYHNPRDLAALFPARGEHRSRVVPVERSRGRVQGCGHVDHRRAAVALLPFRAGVMARYPRASGGDTAAWVTGTTVGLLLGKRRRVEVRIAAK